MYVERLSLQDYRNYSRASVVLAPGLNGLVGPNGQGKTNLLEALFVLAGRRPPRFGGNSELIRWEQGEAKVRAAVVRDGTRIDVGGTITAQGGRRLQVSGKQLRVASRSPLAATFFCPETLSLVRGGAQVRRDLLDDLVERRVPAFAETRREYARVVRQRNRLLTDGRADCAKLAPWDAQLAQLGARVVSERRAMTTHITPALSQAYASLAGEEGPTLGATYASRALESIDGATEDEIAERLVTEIERRRRDELARGVTLVGPHRDDVTLTLGGHALRSFGSQGEQRTAALALALAEAEVLTQTTGEEPVLLLDDVFSELDGARRQRLLELVGRYEQVVITATTAKALKKKAVRVFEIAQGAVTRG